MVDILYQPTPNPNSMKFTLDRKVVESGSKSYMNKEAAEESPLARALFEVEGVASLFMLGNFITVNKEPQAAWEDLVPKIEDVLRSQLS